MAHLQYLMRCGSHCVPRIFFGAFLWLESPNLLHAHNDFEWTRKTNVISTDGYINKIIRRERLCLFYANMAEVR